MIPNDTCFDTIHDTSSNEKKNVNNRKSNSVMREDYQYILDPSSKKFRCPRCEQKRFVCYIDKTCGKYLPQQFGRCDREEKCSYHLNPYSEGYYNLTDRFGSQNSNERYQSPVSASQHEFSSEMKAMIPLEILKNTWHGWEQNIFIQNLLHTVPFPFEINEVEKLIAMYGIGTICGGYRTGATTFPFIDINKNIHAIQVKQFNQANHTTSSDFIHAVLKSKYKDENQSLPDWLIAYLMDEKTVTCLFGEHLLKRYPENIIVLVEAPKTALIGTLYFGFPNTPDKLLWLAAYNRSSLTMERCKVLQGRKVLLIPDLSKDGGTFKLWTKRANEFNRQIQGANFQVYDFLERHADKNDRDHGNDFADVLIRSDWRSYRTHNQPALELMPKTTCEEGNNWSNPTSIPNSQYPFTENQNHFPYFEDDKTLEYLDN